MPRRPRSEIVVPGYPHHVIFRGNNRRILFYDDNARLAFIRALARTSREHECPVHQLTLMTNHGHSAITASSPEALSHMMKSTLQSYAQSVNRLRGSTGKLFEQRFFSDPILEEAHMQNLIPYAELNPERAGLRGPKRFRWTTLAYHTGEGESAIPFELWTPSPWFLELGADDAARHREFRALLERRRAAGRIPAIDAREIDPRRGHRPQRPGGGSAR